jgi:uncharacterized protein (TIGR03000 family)
LRFYVANWECYPWHYWNCEYCGGVLDCCGCYIPGALILAEPLPEKLDPPRLLDSAQAALRLTVPEGAQLFVNDRPVEVTRQTHVLIARDLARGQRRTFSLRAVYTTRDEYATVMREVSVGAGDDVRVALTVPKEIVQWEQKIRPEGGVAVNSTPGFFSHCLTSGR